MPPEEKSETPSVTPTPLRTYQSDVEEMLKGGQGSLAKIAIAEDERRRERGVALEPEAEDSSRAKSIVIISLSLVGLGLLALGVVYFLRHRTATVPAPVTEERPLITTDAEKPLRVGGLGREGMLEMLQKASDDTAGSLSSVTALSLTGADSKSISAAEFLGLLGTRAPSAMVRTLDSRFMFGFHAFPSNQPFIIFKTNYYQNAFAGMLAWEATLEDDLGPLFIKSSADTAAYASTTEEALAIQRTFEDVVVKNRDTRALRDANGEIVFLYSFPDKSTIVLTTNADTLEEIASRVISSKLVQ